MMFISVLAKMVSKVKKNMIEGFESKEDKLIANVLIDYQNRADMLLLKEQSIINDYVIFLIYNFLLEKLEKRSRIDRKLWK